MPETIEVRRTAEAHKFAKSISIFNDSDHEAYLVRLDSPCGCTLAREPDNKTIAAHGHLPIQLDLTPPLSGKKNVRVSITLQCDGKTLERTVTARLIGEAPVIYSFQELPRSLLVDVDSESLTGEQSFTVTTVERAGEPRWLLGFTDDSHRTTVEDIGTPHVVTSPDDEGVSFCRYSFVVKAQPAGSEAQVRLTRIRPVFSMSSPSPEIDIPLELKLRERVRMIPEVIRFNPSDAVGGSRRVLLVSHSAFTIEADQSADRRFNIECVTDGCRDRHILNIAFDPDMTHADVKEAVVALKASAEWEDHTRSLVTIPVDLSE
ncbi:MAG: hypothetical protein Q8K78_06585 [Planctomycetaceae bacterium]|nr:hypothetical protein [Planctomycetaceae bacterium]